MQNEKLMARIMDGLDTINKELKTAGERMVRVEDTVKRHDEVTFPDMKKELEKQSNALYRMESKQNDDIAHFTAEKEAIIMRIKPLEDDYLERQKVQKEKKDERKELTMDVKKGFIGHIVDGIKIALIALITWIITK